MLRYDRLIPALRRAGLLVSLLALAACTTTPAGEQADTTFTLAVIPDTQNYLDYRHQTAEGFAFDGADLFIEQMRDIAARDDVAFVASVGDVWQHQSADRDPAHEARGIGAMDNPIFAAEVGGRPETRTVEMPKAVEGYRILHDAGLPFGVAPGNHDYDALWSVEGYPPAALDKPVEEIRITREDLGALHVAGLDNFRAVFGAHTAFFRDKPWYVASYRGGANSAQVFEAGGYRFLNIALEMSPDDHALTWASDVIRAHPGIPTIITTHDYLDTHGERKAVEIIDLAAIDPHHHNSAEQVWEKLISTHDQVFLVLSGHHHGQNHRIDANREGHHVYQLLADYQGRGQAVIDSGQPNDPRTGRHRPLGDGWYRLMRFDMGGDVPQIKVETWSSHYRQHAGELSSYADWYRAEEQPDLSEAEFLALEEFTLELVDFRKRFGPPAAP